MFGNSQTGSTRAIAAQESGLGAEIGSHQVSQSRHRCKGGNGVGHQIGQPNFQPAIGRAVASQQRIAVIDANQNRAHKQRGFEGADHNRSPPSDRPPSVVLIRSRLGADGNRSQRRRGREQRHGRAGTIGQLQP